MSISQSLGPRRQLIQEAVNLLVFEGCFGRFIDKMIPECYTIPTPTMDEWVDETVSVWGLPGLPTLSQPQIEGQRTGVLTVLGDAVANLDLSTDHGWNCLSRFLARLAGIAKGVG